MKKLSFLISCLFVILLFMGCARQNRKTSKHTEITKQTTEEVFPEVMVGVWEAKVSELSRWGIKFEQDGSIKKIIHSLAGPVNVTEGGVHAERPDGYYYIFAMGPCEANYIPDTGILKVKIIVDHYEMKLPGDLLEGRIEDYFEGPVSKDGKTWKVELRRYGWLDGATPPAIDIIDAHPQELVFTKIDINDPNNPGL